MLDHPGVNQGRGAIFTGLGNKLHAVCLSLSGLIGYVCVRSPLAGMSDRPRPFAHSSCHIMCIRGLDWLVRAFPSRLATSFFGFGLFCFFSFAFLLVMAHDREGAGRAARR
jgi:hypothetical protein